MSQYPSPILHRLKSLRQFCSANELVEDLRSNIEGILNSRLPIFSKYLLRSDPRCKDSLLDDSLANFGIADIQSLNLGEDKKEKRFCDSVRMAISRFEPRIGNVKVEMVNSSNSRIINLEVRGILLIHPFEDVRFESGLDANTQEFIVD